MVRKHKENIPIYLPGKLPACRKRKITKKSATDEAPKQKAKVGLKLEAGVPPKEINFRPSSEMKSTPARRQCPTFCCIAVQTPTKEWSCHRRTLPLATSVHRYESI